MHFISSVCSRLIFCTFCSLWLPLLGLWGWNFFFQEAWESFEWKEKEKKNNKLTKSICLCMAVLLFQYGGHFHSLFCRHVQHPVTALHSYVDSVCWLFQYPPAVTRIWQIANLGHGDGFFFFSPSHRSVRTLMKVFGLSFMDSLVLLNVQQQKRQSLAAPCRLTHQYKVDTVEWFYRSQPTGGGRQLGLSRPVRTETVNTAMAPALLSGTNRGEGLCSGEDSPLSTLQFPSSSRKAFSCLLVWCNVRQDLWNSITVPF